MTDFIAKLKYLSNEEGVKRKTPAYSGYRPQIKFPFSENMTSGKQVFLDKEVVTSGDSVTAKITILGHITLYSGLEFEFKEGNNNRSAKQKTSKAVS